MSSRSSSAPATRVEEAKAEARVLALQEAKSHIPAASKEDFNSQMEELDVVADFLTATLRHAIEEYGLTGVRRRRQRRRSRCNGR